MSDDNLDNSADTESQLVEEVKGSSAKPSILDILESKDETEDSDSVDESIAGTDEPTEPETEEDEETEEEEQEEPVEEEEDEELTASFGGLKKKYPNIFKDFPGLRNKLGREYAFSDLFPTLDQARASAKKSEVFDIYEREIQLGNPEAIIGALPNLDAANKFAERILPALRSAHPDLLTKAVDPFVRMMLNKIDKDSTASGDKNLNLSAKYIARYLYGKSEIPSLPTRQSNQPDPEKEELRARVNQHEQRDNDNFENSLTTSVKRALTKEVGALLDPKETLTPKLREVLIKQIIEETDSELASNPTHMAKIRAFREKAFKSGLGDEHRTRILSAYLATARPVLRTISQRIKTEALGKKNESKTLETQDKGKKVIPSSSGRGINPPSPKTGNLDWRNIKQAKAKGLQMEDILGG